MTAETASASEDGVEDDFILLRFGSSLVVV